MMTTTSCINNYKPAAFFFYSKPRTANITFHNNNISPLLSFNHSRPIHLHLHKQHHITISLLGRLHHDVTRHHNGDGGGGDEGAGGGGGRRWDDDDGWFNNDPHLGPLLLLLLVLYLISNTVNKTTTTKGLLLFLLSSILLFACSMQFTALAKTTNTINQDNDNNHNNQEDEEDEEDDDDDDDDDDVSSVIVWEVKGGQWMKLIPDLIKDSYRLDNKTRATKSSTLGSSVDQLFSQIFIRLMLPEGYPHSVTSDYLDYSLWRGVQGVASQISGVLATQSLLYAVGLGKGVIPTAAAINWVLKDGIGYLSKILLSKYGRHFDVNPKGWRLFADLLENAAFGLEMLTPAFPNLFVPIGAAAGAGRSAAALIQAATRSCFYAGFAAQRNFAEVIAKGEAQGMVSKSIGIMLGIALANYVGSSTSLALVSFGMITWVHMYCNLKSYQCIQLRTFNPYRASLVFSEYLLSGQVPPVKDVNDEEPLFPAVPFLNSKLGSKVQSVVLTREAKDAATEIDHRLLLGAKLSSIAHNKQDALALFDLYKNEGYILTEHRGRYCVILKESCTPQDMLKSLFQANYLYWLESNAGIKSINTFDDCRTGGRLNISLEYVQREFNHVKYDWELAGWTADGLIARPSPNRIRQDFVGNSSASQ